MDRSPPEPSVRGILQAWTLEWVAWPFRRGSSRPRDYTCGPVSLLHRQAGSLPLVSLGKPAFWFSLFKNLWWPSG